MPDRSTPRRRQRTLTARLPRQGGRGPLNLLVDGRGIKVRGKRSNGTPASVAGPGGFAIVARTDSATWRIWRKVRLGIDGGEEDRERPRWSVSPTNTEVGAVEGEPANGSHVGDARASAIGPRADPNVLPDLPGRIPEGDAIGSVTADGARDTRRCHDAIAKRDAHAVIRIHPA